MRRDFGPRVLCVLIGVGLGMLIAAYAVLPYLPRGCP